MRILNEHSITNLLTLNEIITAVEAAMIAYEHQSVLVPQRMHVNHVDDTLLCMPAWGENYIGTKLVTVTPANQGSKNPVINGGVLLIHGKTGVPAALINASKLTALRTGALGAIAVKYLTPSHESSIGLIGCGVQGIHQAIFSCAVRKLSTIYFLHRSDESAKRLTSFVHAYFPDVSMKASYSAAELLSKTNIIIAATTSIQPVLPDNENLLRGKHFISIGSYKPSMQELPDSVYKLAGKLFIDSEFARHETGDCINPVRKGLLRETEIFTLGKVLTNVEPVDTSITTVYKSAGMAVYDLFVAQALFEKAEQLNEGVQIEF